MPCGLEAEATLEGLLALYDDQVTDVYAFVFRRCGDQTLAEDTTQEVFLAVADRFRATGEVPSPAWLYRVARSRLIDHWRREARRVRKFRLIGAADADGCETDPAEQVASAQRLKAALDRLPADHRAVLMLRYLEDLTVNEIAETIGRSRRATESLLVRARHGLEVSYGGDDGE